MKTRLARSRTWPSQTPARRPEVMRLAHPPRLQAKLTVSTPHDPAEREADAVADRVMRMPHVQRLCTECEDELHAKAQPGEIPQVPAGFEQRFAALHGSGQPLPEGERAFFEPRFGRDFSNVRVHAGGAAGDLAQSVHARAFTLGDSIVVGAGQYAPGTSDGRRLIAHELTHVTQQGASTEARTIRRQTIHASCAGHEDLLRDAWREGQRMAGETAETIERVVDVISNGDRPETIMPSVVQQIRNNFGDPGFAPGLTFLPDLARRYRRIEAGFVAGRTIRCDSATVGNQDECQHFDAFVIPGNSTDVFTCPTMFNPERTAVGRGVTLVHEMAHSVLHIDHEGGLFQIFGCGGDLGLEYDVAKRNAYPYGILANCLHGEGASEGTASTVPLPAGAAQGPVDRRWTLSASAGADLSDAAHRFAGVLGARYSFRSGQVVVFNPTIGFNVLYLPPGAPDEHLAAATLDLGLRIQQPLRGVYFDLNAGGLAGFTVDPRANVRPTAGVTAGAGLGYRWDRIELGVESRALLPFTTGDSNSVLILGRLGIRLGSSR